MTDEHRTDRVWPGDSGQRSDCYGIPHTAPPVPAPGQPRAAGPTHHGRLWSRVRSAEAKLARPLPTLRSRGLEKRDTALLDWLQTFAGSIEHDEVLKLWTIYPTQPDLRPRTGTSLRAAAAAAAAAMEEGDCS